MKSKDGLILLDENDFDQMYTVVSDSVRYLVYLLSRLDANDEIVSGLRMQIINSLNVLAKLVDQTVIFTDV